jgi:PAS domain S-box-containing protein
MSDRNLSYVSLQKGLAEALALLKPSDHLCLIHASREEWKNAVIPFLRDGLEKGEKCLYIVADRTVEDILRLLETEGLDPRADMSRGALSILNHSEAYTRDAAFDPDVMIADLVEETRNALSRGFPALRITGEMSWALEGHPGSDFFPRRACLALCQYDKLKCPPEIIKSAILTHPYIIHENRISRNFYYVPPEEFLDKKQPDLVVRHWLESIKRENLNEVRYQVFLESTSDPVFMKDERFRYIMANRAFLNFLGKREEEVLGRKDSDLLPPNIAASFRSTDEKVLQHDGLVGHEEVIDGRIYESRRFPVPMSRGHAGIGGILRDVTDRKNAEATVRKNERKYRDFFRTSRDCIFITSPEGRWVDFNDAAMELLGYDERAELAVVPIQDTYADPGERKHLLGLLQGRDFLRDHPLDLKRRDGTVIHVLITVAVLRDVEGRIESLQGTLRDVTEQKRAEENLKTALKEKEILLREIHHRIKNNMQIISSLLSLQARTIPNPELREILAVCQGRLKSMALIHEKLYQSKDFSAVDFRSYIEVLTAHLFSLSGSERSGIRAELDVGDIRLDITRAIPCGLIINELVSNALTHAFPGGRPGAVRIAMKAEEGGRLELTIADDGCGLSASVNVADPATLGLQIVRDLVQQIDGTLSHTTSDAGTVFTIRF